MGCIAHYEKCAGTSITATIKQNFKSREYLILDGQQPEERRSKDGIISYIKAMSDRTKQRLRVIHGANAFYGLHDYFPERDVRYIMMVQNPTERTASHYNFLRMKLDKLHGQTNTEMNDIRHQLICEKNRGDH